MDLGEQIAPLLQHSLQETRKSDIGGVRFFDTVWMRGNIPGPRGV
jgi:hypothetical protein